MRAKIKPEYDAETIQDHLVAAVCDAYIQNPSIRSIAKHFHLSPMKTRKILITGHAYSSEMCSLIMRLYQDGKTISEIATFLQTTASNVNSYLPYERIIYKLEEKSVDADRQKRYRDRKNVMLPALPLSAPLPQLPSDSEHTLCIVIGKRLYSWLPSSWIDEDTDPLGRFKDSMKDGEGEYIWCAEGVEYGMENNVRRWVFLMNSRTGFMIRIPFSEMKTWMHEGAEDGNTEDSGNIRPDKDNGGQKAQRALETILQAFLMFGIPKIRAEAYTCAIDRIRMVKGRESATMRRLVAYMESKGDSFDDVYAEARIVSDNFAYRVLGNSQPVWSVDHETLHMLKLTEEEKDAWIHQIVHRMLCDE